MRRAGLRCRAAGLPPGVPGSLASAPTVPPVRDHEGVEPPAPASGHSGPRRDPHRSRPGCRGALGRRHGHGHAVTLVIREIPYSQVAPWRSPAVRDHVALGPTSNTTWFGAFDTLANDPDPAMLAVAGIIKVGKAHRIKGVWVAPVMRMQGVGT